MATDLDPTLLAMFGSRGRLLTVAVLANADEPLTGYRIAQIADLPRQIVYPEIRRGLVSKAIEEVDGKYRLADPDLRGLLRKRVPIVGSREWDAARKGWAEETPALLAADLADIRGKLRKNRYYLRPKGWKPSAANLVVMRELARSPEKDASLRRAGLRTSARKD